MTTKPNPIWHSSIGPIRVSDMDDGHLVNTIKLLQRRAFQNRSNAIVQAAVGLSSSLEDFMEADITEFAPPVYYAMMKEARSKELWFPDEPDVPVPPYMTLWETEEDD